MHFKTRVTVAIAEFGEQHLQHAGLLDSARSTSGHCTLPEPSQMEFTGASR